ncbi:hypothetical protein [Psychroflexus sp. ALD_RP9]|uniref:hypothetical protein n=1 Tax=Psychroflexus sp. ALD_RP9 TaxID=2777186 RepID=UPI001A902A62|nr:hypothetical protein [Psychroflexus sp. ALD_RP9]QSS98279.1 hypothetical protein IMZ30_01090 [Psychroflexus sp. ALD_RP9]
MFLKTAFKGEKAISLGNLIGSNIFNMAPVLGITSMIKPIALQSKSILSIDIFWMIGFAKLSLILALLPKQHSIGRYKGALILIPYLIFVVLAFRV